MHPNRFSWSTNGPLIYLHKNGPIFHSYGPDLGISEDPGTCRSPANEKSRWSTGRKASNLDSWDMVFVAENVHFNMNLLLELGIHTLNLFKYLSVEVRQKCIHDIVSDFTEKSGQIRILTYTYQPGEGLFGIVTPTHHFHWRCSDVAISIQTSDWIKQYY